MNWKNLFQQFEPELIEEIEKEAVFKTVDTGDVLMRKGQYVKSIAFVLSGCIKIYRENEDGEEFFMYYISPGELCMGSVISTSLAPITEITAIAEVTTDLLMVAMPAMDNLMLKYKSCYQFVIQTYLRRLEDLAIVIDNIAFRNMDERLEFYLKRHAERNGKGVVELSHQQIADDLNSSREVISRLLKKMEQRNMIRLQRNMIELLPVAVPQ